MSITSRQVPQITTDLVKKICVNPRDLREVAARHLIVLITKVFSEQSIGDTNSAERLPC